MSPFVVLALFAQACLIQSVMSQQCGCGQISYGYSPAPISIGCSNMGGSGLSLGNIGLSNFGSNSGVSSLGSNSGVSSLGSQVLSSVSSASCGSYGGVGTGKVGVAGDIGVGGNTVVVGSVPVLGSVDFSGTVPASGSVSISGQCGCGCQ
ncbi:hypothetical protein MSG28_014967 [Choristoneura fumiferana]|uniref:Uncharacterized protein n=1 Tax=Choristoneura fumiferana TaxID=7141 RepID=A0ACC0KYI4_CHOFU|nr:hypothetical protein MSG28_014967 [Choristoneura fumiferana]